MLSARSIPLGWGWAGVGVPILEAVQFRATGRPRALCVRVGRVLAAVEHEAIHPLVNATYDTRTQRTPYDTETQRKRKDTISGSSPFRNPPKIGPSWQCLGLPARIFARMAAVIAASRAQAV
jgi:hypothetical protein